MTTATMAKTRGKTPPADEPKQPPPISYRPDDAVRAALGDFRDKQELKTSVQAVIDLAVRLFLRDRGYTDIPEKKPQGE